MKDSPHASLREAFFDRTTESFIILDKNLTVVDVNETLLRSLRIKREQMVGKNILEISPDMRKEKRYTIYREVLRTGEPYMIDEVRPHPSFGNHLARIYVFKLGDGIGVVAQNITDLYRVNEELETFIYKASHDLRGPILSILGLTNLFNNNNLQAETMQEYSEMIKNQAEKLDLILFKLIETTRIRKGEKIIHLINFGQFIHDLRKFLLAIEGSDQIEFTQDVQVKKKFYGDHLLLTSLFQNLLDNAIKYRNTTIQQSYIKVKIADEEGGIKIQVADNGVGIPEHLQPHVFNMFFRANNNKPGAGLGLYTVSHAVKKMEGQISFISTEGVGTTFTIYLPNEFPNGTES